MSELQAVTCGKCGVIAELDVPAALVVGSAECPDCVVVPSDVFRGWLLRPEPPRFASGGVVSGKPWEESWTPLPESHAAWMPLVVS